MFTDIVGSTALRDELVAKHGESVGDQHYRQQISDPHNQRIRTLLAGHDGFEVKTIGDSFMVAFGEAADGVLCAAAIQKSLRDEPIATADGPLAVRIGLHTGAAKYVERDGKPDYDGHAVNIAARVEGLLKGGGRIYCSGETAAVAKVPSSIRLHNYGPCLLKGVSGKVEIYEVLWDDSLEPVPPEVQDDALPYPWLTRWVGREREMTMLAEALQQSRLVTLLGPGGVGKTRTAVETLLVRGAGLPRELVFVPLEKAADSPSGLLGALRDALGLSEADAPDLSVLCRRLHGGGRLLILDNFESVISDAGSVSSLATTLGLRVLVTSQQALGAPGERVVRLDPMETRGDASTLESYRLFTVLAQQRDASWQPDDDLAMRRVLAATDGLPYLIELVAAVAPKRKLAQLADELEKHIDAVRARTHDATRKKQHESVEACLDWALGRLPAEERGAMPRLAVFSGGFDAEAAEEVAGTAVATLDVLIDASLLRFDQHSGRYSMLSTTRQYGSGVLTVDESARLNEAHARWFIERLDRADDTLRARGGDAQRSARRWISEELENLNQSVAWAEENDPALFWRAVNAFSVYLNQTSRLSELVRLHEVQLQRLDPGLNAQSWAGTQNNLGIAYWNLPTGNRGDNVTKAIACYEAALRVYTEGEFPIDWAATQNNLGIAYADLPAGAWGKNLTKAIACYEAALRVYTEGEFPIDWAMTQNNLGAAYGGLPKGDQGENAAKAIACYKAALRVRTEGEFPIAWAMTQNNLGAEYGDLSTGDRENVSKAIACFEAALRVYTEGEFPIDWAMTQNNLGAAYRNLPTGDRRENVSEAIACYEAALRVYTEREFPIGWANTQKNLGLAYDQFPGGDWRENVAKAMACYAAAERGYSACGLADEAEEARKWAEELAARTSET